MNTYMQGWPITNDQSESVKSLPIWNIPLMNCPQELVGHKLDNDRTDESASDICNKPCHKLWSGSGIYHVNIVIK